MVAVLMIASFDSQIGRKIMATDARMPQMIAITVQKVK